MHSADGWDGVLKPVVARYQGKLSRIYFRADAAFAMPEVYEFLEANRVLQDRIGYLLERPVGRPAHHVRRCHASFSYQAGSWSRTALAANVRHDSRVHLIAPLPSLIHCSHVPRLL